MSFQDTPTASPDSFSPDATATPALPVHEQPKTIGLSSNGHITPKPSAASMQNGHQALEPHQGKNGLKPHWQVVLIPVEQIAPSPYQPRQNFDATEMAELVASVREHGVQQPVLVRTAKTPSAKVSLVQQAKTKASKPKEIPTQAKTPKPLPYELVAGERRLRACKEAKRRFVPAIVRDDLSDAQAAELALLENVQRSNLTVIEEATAYKRLMLEFRMKEERIAKKVGKSPQTIRDIIRLLQLPAPVRAMLGEKKLTPTHGQHLLRLSAFESACILVAQKVVSDNLTATSLGNTPLPNARELCQRGLAVELDYRTKFDWKNICGTCSHKAYLTSGFASFCLKPAEWQRKQSEAIEQQKLEAARVLEAARSQEKTEVNVDVVPPGSYRELSFVTPPAGCNESCPCRGEAPDPRDPTKKKSVCLDPNRFTLLVRLEREALEEERKRRYTGFWQDAKTKLEAEVANDHLPPLAAIALLPLLSGAHLRYGETEAWQTLASQVAGELSLQLPLTKLFDEEISVAEALALLSATPIADLLRFTACLLLAHEALGAVRLGGQTPMLSAVLGHTEAVQTELAEEDESTEDGLVENVPAEYAEDEADFDLPQNTPPTGEVSDFPSDSPSESESTDELPENG